MAEDDSWSARKWGHVIALTNEWPRAVDTAAPAIDTGRKFLPNPQHQSRVRELVRPASNTEFCVKSYRWVHRETVGLFTRIYNPKLGRPVTVDLQKS